MKDGKKQKIECVRDIIRIRRHRFDWWVKKAITKVFQKENNNYLRVVDIHEQIRAEFDAYIFSVKIEKACESLYEEGKIDRSTRNSYLGFRCYFWKEEDE